jgi:MSHA biogenesis protein MshN
MSLINKMLRDLDARRGGEGDRAALPAAVTPLAARQMPSLVSPLMLLGTLTLVTVLGAVAWYKMETSPPRPVVAVAPAPLPAVATPAATPPVPPPATPAVAPEATAVQAVVPVPAATEKAAMETVTPPPAAAATLAPPSLRMAGELSMAPVPDQVPPRKTASAAPKPAEPKTAPPKRPEPKAAEPKVAEPKTAEPKITVSKTTESKPEAAATATVAVPRAPTSAAGKSAPAVDGRIDKQERLPSPAERAEAEYRRALQAYRLGNMEQAAAGYRATLADYPEHAAARQTLAAMLIDARRYDEADELLSKGTELAAVRLASILALARLKVERNQTPAALELLQKNAAAGESSAEYQGFAGALLNRAGRSAEAVERYLAATRLAPNEGRWWAGLGIALDAAGRPAEAREAYQKARSLPGLPADLAQHVEQRLR